MPTLVYSCKCSDQSGCAARVHYHGLGLMADKDVDDTKKIRAKIDLVLTSKSIDQSLKKFKPSSFNSGDLLPDVLKEVGIRGREQMGEVS